MSESSPQLIRSGWLIKVGGGRKTWRKRYDAICVTHKHGHDLICVLTCVDHDKCYGWCCFLACRHFVVTHTDRSLRFTYYKSPPSDRKQLKPLGSFELQAAESFRLLEPPASPLSHAVMEVITSKRTYQMYAESEAEFLEWAWAIERSIGFLRARTETSITSQAQVVFTGFLKKKGGQRHNWKTRWFQLKHGRLQYLNQRKDRALGTINIADCIDVCRVYHSGGYFQFHLRTAVRTYKFRASNEGELVDWLHCIHQAGCPLGQAEKASNATFYDDVDDDDNGDSEEEGQPYVDECHSETEKKLHAPNRHRSITAPAGRLAAPDARSLELSFHMSFADLHRSLQPACLIATHRARVLEALPETNPFAKQPAARPSGRAASVIMRPARSAESMDQLRPKGQASPQGERPRSSSLHNPFRELQGLTLAGAQTTKSDA
eukprot:TRINITY_DN6051_c0_g1_i3.p1 TRINITY_DN6051_c0_g1~~TRINITY_DN6051_c0_g1_i3.p1  ORF type:complete len:434 (+),score=49.05 TRINITY_DN6051_c0_g1_i3:227-1528(+)